MSNISAPSVVPPVITPLVSGASVSGRIITPYRASAFEEELRKHGLLDKHPTLVDRLRKGFPVGNFTPRTVSFTPPNSHAGTKHLAFIQDYVDEEVSLQRMSGPYTRAEVERILQAKFVSSPLYVVEKAGSPGKKRLIQNSSFKDASGLSVNDEIDSDDFPTKWGTAAEVAEIVSNRDSRLPHSRQPFVHSHAVVHFNTSAYPAALRLPQLRQARKQHLSILNRPFERSPSYQPTSRSS